MEYFENKKAEEKNKKLYNDKKELIDAVCLLKNYENDKIMVKVINTVWDSTEFESTPIEYEVRLKDEDNTTVFRVSTMYKEIKVYRQGMWEKHLLEMYKEKLESIRLGYQKQEEIEEKYKQLEKSKFKPIDDSKFFN